MGKVWQSFQWVLFPHAAPCNHPSQLFLNVGALLAHMQAIMWSLFTLMRSSRLLAENIEIIWQNFALPVTSQPAIRVTAVVDNYTRGVDFFS